MPAWLIPVTITAVLIFFAVLDVFASRRWKSANDRILAERNMQRDMDRETFTALYCVQLELEAEEAFVSARAA